MSTVARMMITDLCFCAFIEAERTEMEEEQEICSSSASSNYDLLSLLNLYEFFVQKFFKYLKTCQF